MASSQTLEERVADLVGKSHCIKNVNDKIRRSELAY